MATPYDKIQIRKVTQTFPDLFQENFPGASKIDSERGWWPDLPLLTIGNKINDWARLGNLLFFVGIFASVGGTTRTNAACIDLTTGLLTPWDPNLNLEGITIKIDPVNKQVYIGGVFTDVNSGTTRNRLARFNTTDGTVDVTWDPDINLAVEDILIDGTDIYIVGQFTDVNSGTTRNRAAKFTVASDIVSADFAVDANSGITTITFDETNRLIYFGGTFTTIDGGGTARNRAACWDVDLDSSTAFDINLDSDVFVIRVIDEDSIWVGGGFATVLGGTARRFLANFNAAGLLLSPDFGINLGGFVFDIEPDTEGSAVYVAGFYTTVLSTTRNNICKIITSDFSLDNWNPDANGPVFSVFVFQNTCYAGGAFTTINGVSSIVSAAIQDPFFTDTNALFVSKLNGDDANPGTKASPKKTIASVYATTPSITDGSGNGHTLIENGTVPNLTRSHVAKPASGNFAKGPFSNANFFSGPVSLETALSSLTTLTLEGYVYLRTFNTDNRLISFDAPGPGNDWSVNVTSTGQVEFEVDNTTHATAAGLIETGRRYNIACTYDGTNKKIYIDGNLALDVVQGGANTNAVNSIAIGRHFTTNNQFINGYLDRFMIYNTVESIFPSNGGPGLIAKYDFQTDPPQKDIPYTVIDDSETYRESFETLFPDDAWHLGLFAGYGQAPTLNQDRGAVAGTFGARASGREKFSTGLPATFYHVSKAGNDSTGARGDVTLPFLTIQAALDDGSRIDDDTVQIEDSGVYNEDINIGAFDCTLQAANGKVPQIRAVGGQLTIGTLNPTLIITDIGTGYNLFGLTLIQSKQGGTSGPIIVGKNEDSQTEFYDCTFLSGIFAVIDLTSVGSRTTMINCLFLGGSVTITDLQGGAVVDNCFSDSRFEYNTFAEEQDMVFKNSTIEADCFIIAASQGSGIIGSVVTVRNSIFNSLSMNSALLASAVAAFNVESPSIIMSATGLDDGADAYIANSLSRNSPGIGFEFSNVDQNNSQILGENCIAIGAETDGFNIDARTTTGSNSVSLNQCVAINSGVNGVNLGSDPSSRKVTGIIEKGSGTASFSESGSGTISVINSVFETPSSGSVTLGNSLNEDPLIINSTPGSENSALSGSSAGVTLSGDFSDQNSGLIASLVTSTQRRFEVSGLILESEKNFLGGVRFKRGDGIGNLTEHCTMTGLGPHGITTSITTLVTNCFFKELNGMSILLGGISSIVERCVSSKSKSAFIVFNSPLGEVRNNSSFLCEFGQIDKPQSQGFVFKNNIYATSGLLDYSGILEQRFSDIGTLSENASVDANSTRQDPLYRDRLNNDLRLGVIEAGFFFDSPAKLAGDDGFDMGAFKFFYGTPVDDELLIDFASTDYINPDHILRSEFHVRLVEDAREDASERSKSIGTKKKFVFTWDSVARMPDAQREDLLQLFELENSDMEISFDGGSVFIPVTLLRRDDFEFQEIDGDYRDSALAQPVRRLVFRER